MESSPNLSTGVLPPLQSLSDNELVAQCVLKHGSACDALVSRYLSLVYNVIYQMVQHPQQAEDLTQETFLRLFRALDQYNPNRPFKPWLITIAVNVTKTAMKKQSQRREVFLSDDDPDSLLRLENLSDEHSVMLDDTISDTHLQNALVNALNQLPERMKQALLLRHIHQLSYEEIAQALDANLNSVRTWLRRGREKLLTQLQHTEA